MDKVGCGQDEGLKGGIPKNKEVETGKHRQWSEISPGNDNGQGAVEPRWSCAGGETEKEVSLPAGPLGATKVIHLKATRHK